MTRPALAVIAMGLGVVLAATFGWMALFALLLVAGLVIVWGTTA